MIIAHLSACLTERYHNKHVGTAQKEGVLARFGCGRIQTGAAGKEHLMFFGLFLGSKYFDLKQLIADDRGISAVEYAALALGVITLIAAVFSTFGIAVQNYYGIVKNVFVAST
jgi:Flp pilus assembly pilin Flp